MKRFSKLCSLLAVALLALTACDKPAPEGEASVITLATQTLSVKAEGGDYTVRYSIANPVEGEELKFDYDAEWIESIVAEAGNIKISVATNEGGERTAEVVVGYKSAESITLSVKQEAAAPEAISVVIEELTGNSCITAVTPVDPEMYYVMYKSDLSYFLDNNLLTAEALFDDDMFYFKRGAEYDGISLKKYMERNKVLFQGKTRAAWPGIRPGEQSVIYAYGVKFNEAEDDCEMITSIAWSMIEPPLAERRTIDFDVEYSVDGANVAFNISPKGYDGYYTMQIFGYNEEQYFDPNGEMSEEEYADLVAHTWINLYCNNLAGGITEERILDMFCHKGEATVERELMSYTLYTAVIYALEMVDGHYQMVSEPKIVNFSTEEVTASDMTIDIEVESYVRICDLKITPSVDDETYIMLFTPTEYMKPNFTDDDLREAVLGEFRSWAYEFRGPISSHMSSLYPSKEYVVIAFGYSGGIVTTPVFKHIFTTDEEGECEVAISEVNYGGPYIISEAMELDPVRFGNCAGMPDDEYFLMWIEVKTDIPTPEIFTLFVDVPTYNDLGEDLIFFDLLFDTCEPLITKTASYNMPYYLCAAAFDHKGDVTPMWRSEVIKYAPSEGKSAQELIDKLNSSTRAQAMVVDRHSGKVVAVR